MTVRDAVTGFFSPTPRADPKVEAATAAVTDAQAKHLASVGDLETLQKAAEVEADKAFASGDRTAYRAAMALVAEQEGIVRAAQRAVEVAERALADAHDAKAAADRAAAKRVRESQHRSLAKKHDAAVAWAARGAELFGSLHEWWLEGQRISDNLVDTFPGAAPLIGRATLAKEIHEDLYRIAGGTEDGRYWPLPFAQPLGAIERETVPLADKLRERKRQLLDLYAVHLGLKELELPAVTVAPTARPAQHAQSTPAATKAAVPVSTAEAARTVPSVEPLNLADFQLTDEEVAAALATVETTETLEVSNA